MFELIVDFLIDMVTRVLNVTTVFFLYNLFSLLFSPLLVFWGLYRLYKKKEYSITNRLGIATASKPSSDVIWIHCASVGESLSALPLVNALIQNSSVHILMTTTTKSSALLLQKRLSSINDRVTHQIIPWDVSLFVRRFLRYWQPKAFVLIESEIWPNMIEEVYSKRIPFFFLNVRMSQKTMNFWKRISVTFSYLFRRCHIYAQSQEVQDFFASFGIDVKHMKNLKYLATDMHVNDEFVDGMKKALTEDPFIVFSSTHPQEEAMFLDVYLELKKDYETLRLIWVPRHPKRAHAIKELCEKNNMTVSLRTDVPFPDQSVWIVNTIGEMGSIYALKGIVVMGGSFCDVEGHNPLEPIAFGNNVFCGPRMKNFSGIMEVFEGCETAIHDKNDLVHALKDALNASDTEEKKRQDLLYENLIRIQKDVHLDLITQEIIQASI